MLQKRQTSLRAMFQAMALLSMSCAGLRYTFEFAADPTDYDSDLATFAAVFLCPTIAYICLFGAIGTLFRPTSDLFAYVTAFGIFPYGAIILYCLSMMK